jgi:hypothetical protein
VQIGDTQFLGVPERELPDWVISKPWPIATFVESVKGYGGSEGIYFATAQAIQNRHWLDGLSDQKPVLLAEPYLQRDVKLQSDSGVSLPNDFRGEYSDAYFRKPALYFSPIDNRMHMLHAQGGVWNLGGGRLLRAHNLRGGAYIDGWTREQVPLPAGATEVPRASGGQVLESLYTLDGYILYTGPRGSELRQATYADALFETRPPTDAASWRAFREQLKPFAGQERAPSDLRTWLDAFPGQTLIASSGPISAVRTTERDFRFVVDLRPGAQVHLPGTGALTPGRYVVAYDGAWSIAPLTPPALSAALREPALTQYAPGQVEVALRNDGREDVPAATLELWGARPSSPATLVVTQTVALLAGTPGTATLQWAPGEAGEWTLTPAISRPAAERVTFAPARVIVEPAPEATSQAVFAASLTPGLLPLALLGMLVFATIAALSFGSQWRASPPITARHRAREHHPE